MEITVELSRLSTSMELIVVKISDSTKVRCRITFNNPFLGTFKLSDSAIPVDGGTGFVMRLIEVGRAQEIISLSVWYAS